MNSYEEFASQLKRFCVFCGKQPEANTPEHVVPTWLLQMTGDTRRPISLFANKANNLPLERSANSFSFPSCKKCNQDYSGLEDKASRVVKKIFSDDVLYQSEISSFLDWLDKIRIGLWLADMLVNKDHNLVKRNFYINNRIARHDRCAL